jgi:RNA polymerase sigma-70 factor (ECF subfamily)
MNSAALATTDPYDLVTPATLERRTALACRAAPPPARPKSELRAQLATCFPDLYRRALRLGRSEETARDLVQDTYERALRFENQYEPGSNLKAWLSRILLSVFVTRCRRFRRERRALENLTHDPCAWTSPDHPTAMQALSSPVARAVLALPEHFREALELVDLAELSYRDAADIIGVPLGTVMSRLHRGRRLLADALRDPARTPVLPEAA